MFDIDPQWTPPTNVFNSGSVFISGPAVLDLGSSLANSGGTVYLTNGGELYLHGNVVVSNMTVEGTPWHKAPILTRICPPLTPATLRLRRRLIPTRAAR